jgi:hypothetical protein
LDQYIAAVGIAGDTAGPLFRTTGRFTGTPHRMTQFDVYRMIQKYGTAAGIKTKCRRNINYSYMIGYLS